MNGTKTPGLRSPYRRRRIIWSLIVLTVVLFLYIGGHPSSSISFGSWSLPAYLKDVGRSPSSSRASLVSDAKAKAEAEKLQVPEIDALLHFVTAFPERRLNEDDGSINVQGLGSVKVNPHEPVDYRVYAPNGDDDWEKHVEILRNEHPLVIFSKTYCPYSKKAKALLLETYNLMPTPTVVELDKRLDGLFIQTILSRLTGRSTVPNIVLQGKSIGGSDDIHQIDDEGKLKSLLESNGVEVFLGT
ncbi:hypothetical protein NM688_g8079 [Phlebia brevispora]|uniref:Uncharacterized protein n=1 Tax=Phlebia brevispora TaxID=194682 RepID=A0ACC1RXK2_9APHY|nr:hypothetical protein NM688_g8079 [Phlebia brevispora]